MNLNKLKEKMTSLREEAEKIATENFVKNKVSESVQKERFDICLSCEHLYKPTNNCKKCGCFMGVKTWMANQRCPLNKWERSNPEIEIGE
jgi:ArsR family metal-binding transcriptional regulator